MGRRIHLHLRVKRFQHCDDTFGSNSVKLHLLKKNEGSFFIFLVLLSNILINFFLFGENVFFFNINGNYQIGNTDVLASLNAR
jgi:hypothetical protein